MYEVPGFGAALTSLTASARLVACPNSPSSRHIRPSLSVPNTEQQLPGRRGTFLPWCGDISVQGKQRPGIPVRGQPLQAAGNFAVKGPPPGYHLTFDDRNHNAAPKVPLH